MNADKKTNQIYAILAVVCAIMAVLIFATAKEETWGGVPLQRMIGWVLIITSISFFSKLNPPKGK
jgi:hypothetical protein